VTFVKSDFLRNAGVLFSSTGIAQIISFLLIPILTRLYTPAEHGIVTLFMSIVAVCVAFTTFQYEQAIVVESNRERAKHLLYLSILITVGWSFLFYSLLFLFQSFIYSFFNIEGNGYWLYLVPVTVVFTTITAILLTWFNRKRSYNKIAVNRVVGMVSGSGYKVVHPFLNILSGNGLVLGHVLGQSLQLILLTPFKRIRNQKINQKLLVEVAKEYIAFPKLATPSALINIVGMYMPVFIISAMIGEEMTGFYGNARALTFIPLSAVSYALGQVYFERLARLRDDKKQLHKLTNDLLKFLFFLAVIPVAVLMIWGDVLVTTILGETWAASGSAVQVIIILFYVVYLTSPFSAAFEVYNALGRQLWFTGSYTVITTLAIYLSLKFSGNVYLALAVHAFFGIIIRLAMLVDCFRLIGISIYIKLIKGILILAGLTLLFAAIKFGFA
jgi:O-antigen/teichoic acid export membrane protein